MCMYEHVCDCISIYGHECVFVNVHSCVHIFFEIRKETMRRENTLGDRKT